MIPNFSILLLCAYGSVGFGYDSGGSDQAACGRPYRSGKMYQPPCDLNRMGYCVSAGQAYPWHAVKRFVKDNQGLMKRMYGDQRHGHVLRVELQEDLDDYDPLKDWQPPRDKYPRYSRYEHDEDIENDVFAEDDLFSEPYNEPRFLRDDVKNDDVLKTKFVYSEEPAMAIKLAGLKTAPHFRPTTQRNSIDRLPEKDIDSKNKDITKIVVAKEEEVTTSNSVKASTTKTVTTTTTEEPTTTTKVDEISSTELNTEQTTIIETIDRVGESSEGESSSTETPSDVSSVEDTQGDSSKPGAILFQDMDDPTKKKMNVNYKAKGVNACPVKEEVVAPFWANNTRGEVLALLNMYPFEQYVHWEKCTFEHRQMYCREGCRCEQQYRLHRLLAYDPNNECRGIFSDWFRFPSCCVCKCYNMPPEFRVTSRSPRFQNFPEDNFG
ncbi:unnamed protein product [Brassicogethes aeneus]|uniref:Spaetzle domain-containing protein n=1 Tax=Brassicogethes aeneus TaxID=1431903 RepID=A0A9P0BJB6_BRAAE|nr:unnamed protein product [Brassicogethes aeneus]